MENLEFDSIAQIMMSKQLLSEEEFTIIIGNPCDFMKNYNLLEHVMVGDKPSLFEFCSVLQETDNEMLCNIGNSMQKGTLLWYM